MKMLLSCWNGFAMAARASTLTAVLLLIAGCAGLSGVTMSPGITGQRIPGVALSFVKEDASAAYSTTSDANGSYSLSMDPGRYYVLATHVDYEDYTTAPGFAVVSPNTRGTANFFLRQPQMTTVLIIRHGEKLDPNSNLQNEPLSQDGEARAVHLRDSLLRSGVSGVYSTNTKRTLDTVKPLAETFKLSPQIYSDPSSLASTVLAQHRGDVVLVAAHSDSVSTVTNAFGANVSTAPINDYDNLYVTSVAGTTVNVVNLQYGADATPDLVKNDRHAMTLLLVGAGAAANAPEPAELLHAARKAGVSAIYSSTPNSPLIAPLATQLALTPMNFNAGDIPAFANTLLTSHGQETVLVAATQDQLRALILRLGAEPLPIVYTTDTDHLVVVTRFPSGATRVIPLRY